MQPSQLRTHRIIGILCATIAVVFVLFVLSFAQPHFRGCVKPTAVPATWYGEC